jgi:hypothetical protein
MQIRLHKINGVPPVSPTPFFARIQVSLAFFPWTVSISASHTGSNLRMTLGVYTHVTSEDDVRVASNLGELLGSEEILDSVGLNAQKEGALLDSSIRQGSWLP